MKQWGNARVVNRFEITVILTNHSVLNKELSLYLSKDMICVVLLHG